MNPAPIPDSGVWLFRQCIKASFPASFLPPYNRCDLLSKMVETWMYGRGCSTNSFRGAFMDCGLSCH